MKEQYDNHRLTNESEKNTHDWSIGSIAWNDDDSLNTDCLKQWR